MVKNVLLRAGIPAVLAGAMLVPAPVSAAEVVNCAADHQDDRQATWTNDGIGFTSELEDNGRPLAPGRYALPETATPTQLVVMFHGHGNDSCSWRRHLQDVAARGAVAVAMDYTGQYLLPDGASYGWFVRAGAADSIAAARYFMATYPTITKVIALGVSMGGNMSGYAVASGAKRSDGSPLFDYWIDIEGVNNLIEEYLVARAVAPFNDLAALAVTEIEQENGGKLEETPEKYIETTNVLRAGDMAYLKGSVVVNGFDDGLVPTDQTPQMTAALTLNGVPTHQINVLLRGSAESGTTGTAIVAGPVFAAAGDEYESPLAGHGWEGSDTHLVIKAGFEALYDLLDGGSVEPGLTIIPGA
jgi:hypothetical protein